MASIISGSDSELQTIPSVHTQSGSPTASAEPRNKQTRKVFLNPLKTFPIFGTTSASSPKPKRKGNMQSTYIYLAASADQHNTSRERPEASQWQSILRSVGLKALAYFVRREEVPKIILSESRRLASTRTAVHILPATITLFLFLFNGIHLLNGPDITGMAKFWLQIAAKFHVSNSRSGKLKMG